MTCWTAREVVAFVLVVTLAVAFLVVVVGSVVHGTLTGDTASALGSGFLLFAVLLAAVLGVHLRDS